MTARAVAFAALIEWRQGRQFADTIIQRLLTTSSLIGSDRGFATELFYGVLRNLTLLDFWIAQLRSGSLDEVSRDLLRLGLYQIFCLQTPTHAAVFETVELSGRRNRALVNAVLRNGTRREAELRKMAGAAPLAIRKSHPEFLVQRWQKSFGDKATEALCDWNNGPAALYGRINRLRTTTERFLAAHPEAVPLPDHPNFVRLEHVPLDGLQRGDCYIQDPSTALSCEVLRPEPGHRVLDACAAPGGKSGLIAELMQNRGQLIACDRDPARLKKLRENLSRLGATCATVIQHDWTSDEMPAGLREAPFDRILFDAPCSNTGVMRRRVDVRWRLRPDDFAEMQRQQLLIARRLVPLLKADGIFVCSTCSIEAEENQEAVSIVLREFPLLRCAEQRASLPFRDQLDGAFVAPLHPAP